MYDFTTEQKEFLSSAGKVVLHACPGSGKTTIMKAIAGIYKVDNGEISINGKKSFENVEVKDKTIYISDELFFFNNFTIKQMSNFYKRVYSSWDQDRFNKLKDVFNIDINRNANRLSKGMKKQVAIWLAVSAKPDVLILDEPLDGLDPVMRKQVLNLVIADVADRELTVLVSSHNLREMEGICDSIGILDHGHMVLERDLDELKSDIHKIQVAFRGSAPEGIYDGLNILHKESRGSVDLLIVRNRRDLVEQQIEAANPAIFDLLPLSLEEIFIYELGGETIELESLLF